MTKKNSNDTSATLPSSSDAHGAKPALEASFSTLVLSLGSSAAMALGLAPNPVSGEVEKDVDLARFNIDLLRMLRDKTKGNLESDELKFLESILSDLQLKFVKER